MGMVAGYAIERKTKNDRARRKKDDGPDPRNDAHEQRQAKQTSLRSKPPVAEFQEFREPAQRMGRCGGFGFAARVHGVASSQVDQPGEGEHLEYRSPSGSM